MAAPILTQERLREILHYDPETGVFTYKVKRSSNAMPGMVAGSVNSRGYVCISVDKKKYQAHRLAWLYMTGEFPKELLDHKDRNRTNNRFSNLRESNGYQNQWNQGMRSTNTSGLKGAFWVRREKKWAANIYSSGKSFHLGMFNTKEEAHAAYCKAALEMRGEFANVEMPEAA